MLTEILKTLLSNPTNQDHILGASRQKKDGLYLCWRPPNVLIITRPGSPGPSSQELTTVQNHLKGLGCGQAVTEAGGRWSYLVLLEADVESGAAAVVGAI